MTINELENILDRHIEGGDRPGEYADGNMCWHCTRKACQYILTGEMYFGQEVGPGKGKNHDIVYECPKFIMANEDKELKSERLNKIKPCTKAECYKTCANEIRAYNDMCKLNTVYKYFSR